jgi:hypothetical protein
VTPAKGEAAGSGVPVARERLVPRTSLIDRLMSSNEPVITGVAPPGYVPVVSLQALLELARTYLALVDPAGARAVLEQAHEILRRRPDLGTLAAAVERLQTGKVTKVIPWTSPARLTTLFSALDAMSVARGL